MALKFLLRPDMPRGFTQNTQYPELPAANQFLLQYNAQEFITGAELAEVLKDFPGYLTQQKVPESSDRALREGFLVEQVNGFPEISNVSLKSDEVRRCWFGTIGQEKSVVDYFQAQARARTQAAIEDDD
jgi:hypothetical protein